MATLFYFVTAFQTQVSLYDTLRTCLIITDEFFNLFNFDMKEVNNQEDNEVGFWSILHSLGLSVNSTHYGRGMATGQRGNECGT